MATSRTGTQTWLALRKQAKRLLPHICSVPSCQAPLDFTAPRCTPNSPELDHIVPHSRGGQDVIENVQWLCFPCNRAKSDGRAKSLPEVKRVRAY